jgi:tetratricopeptide (TPR) repeat protein
MPRDAQGYELTGATAEAARRYDAAVRAYTLAYRDPAAEVEAGLAEAPDCSMLRLSQAWLLALSNDPAGTATARKLAGQMAGLSMNDRERAHHTALTFAAAGRWPSAGAALDLHLMHFPRDLMAHQCVMRLDGFQGRFHWVANRSARALPLWSKDQPGYGILLSFYGFGLEETGDYAQAEAISREAAELEPNGYWPHHAVAHVLEMTGRPVEGLQWMDEREALWSSTVNTNRVHIWWHKSLFHVELGQYQAALDLYDREIVPTLRPLGTSLCNATALLWRLETLGCETGERWGKVAALWKDRANGQASVFNDIHAAMTALRTADQAGFEALREGMGRTAAGGGELASTYRDVGLPVVEAMADFQKGDYGPAVTKLMPIRFELSRMGGSKAQRDLVEWTLTEAALRAGDRDVALALANERLSLRPRSAVNKAFFKRAEALAA